MSNSIKSNPSLFSLAKVQPGDQSVSTIHTVNFITKGDIHTPQLQNYFDSRYRFLVQCYNFAREIKIKENYDFNQSTDTQTKLREYLSTDNKGDLLDVPKASMITGTEFEVMTTKVSESLGSINANPYLDNLEKDIKIKYLNEVVKLKTKDLKPKELEAEIKVVDISLEELFRLESKDIRAIFKYELFDICQTWQTILGEFNSAFGQYQDDYKLDLTNNVLGLINDFLTKSQDVLESTYDEVKLNLFEQHTNGSIKDVVKTFVNRFFFVFDGRIKKLETDYCLEINEKLNEWLQGLTGYLIYNSNCEDNQDKLDGIKNCIYAVQRLDFGNDKTPSKLVQMIKIAVKPEELEKDLFDQPVKTKIKSKIKSKIKNQADKIQQDEQETKTREYNNCFLRHPKSAPSYPDISDRILTWDSINCTSEFLKENKANFSPLKFLDYLLFRTKKVVENDEFYSIYRFLSKSNESWDWSDFLNCILENKEIKINLDSGHLETLKDKNQLEEHTFDIKNNKQKLKQVQRYRFLTSSNNDKFAPIQFVVGGKNKNGKTNSLEEILSTKFNELTNKYSEIYVLKQLNDNNLLDQNWIKIWFESIKLSTKTGDKQIDDNNREVIKLKLGVNTQNRLKYLENKPLKLGNKTILEYLRQYLIKLEKHLLLNTSQNPYKVFDKLSFKRYQNISQVIFETFVGKSEDSFKIIRNKKAELSKLLMDREAVIPLKISRMTNRTNGNSTLVFGVDYSNSSQIQVSQNSFLVCTPIKMESGESLRIVDNLKIALKELQKKDPKYSQLMVGFLNGGGDNLSDEKTNYVLDINGERLTRKPLRAEIISGKYIESDQVPKSYRTYNNWRIKGELNGIHIIHKDNYRGDTEPVGGTSPAGYPKLYYFIVPNNCSSLIIPVESSNYYLKKYNASDYISKYLKLESKIVKTIGQDQVDCFIDLLDLRCKLRFYYAISSFEIDLKQELKLNKGVIKTQISAVAHLQFSNPAKQQQEFDAEKDKIQPKQNYNLEEIKSKFETILSVDLGEKQLAVASLTKIDWNSKKLDTNSAQFYLPLQYRSNDKSTANSNYDIVHNYNFETSLEIDVNQDKTYKTFDLIKKSYKQEQKQFGTVSESLRAKKNNFTDQVIENISTQIAKLADKHKAFVVFERLPTGLSSKKLEISTCNEILIQIYKKLTKIGLTLGNNETYLNNSITKGIARVSPFMTSQTCSNCSYVPSFYKESKFKTAQENEETKNHRVWINDSNWLDRGLIEFRFGIEGQVFASIEDKSGYLECKTKRSGKFQIDSVLSTTNYYKKSNTSYIPILMTQWLQDNLLTKEKKLRVDIKQSHQSLFRATILKPRLTQDQYHCPRCNMKMNADYNATKNIAKVFVDKL